MSFEETIRQIVREEIRSALQELAAETDSQDHSQFPPVLTVKEAAQIANVGVNKVYEWTRRQGFPALRDGWSIRIPREAFFRWLEENALKNTGEVMAR